MKLQSTLCLCGQAYVQYLQVVQETWEIPDLPDANGNVDLEYLTDTVVFFPTEEEPYLKCPKCGKTYDLEGKPHKEVG